jgi:hypothetical protein
MIPLNGSSSGRAGDALLRRRGRTIPPLQVRDFCAAAYSRVFAASLGRAVDYRQQEAHLPPRSDGGHRREHCCGKSPDSDNDVDPVRFGHLIDTLARQPSIISPPITLGFYPT